MNPERIQKIIARAGIASRRNAEKLIVEGVVTVNGKPAKLGDQAIAGKDAIKVNGKLLLLREPPVYLAFNKPKGVLCTFAPDLQDRATLGEFLKKIRTRIFPIGRMDFNSDGLILLTNDGEISEKIQKSAEVARVYHAKVRGQPDESTLKKLAKPQRIEGRRVSPHSVRISQSLAQKSIIEIVLIGQIGVDLKALLERHGLLVERITRQAIGQVSLKGLAPGHYRPLTRSQLEAVVDQPHLAMRAIEAEQAKKVPLPKPRITPVITPKPPIRPQIRPQIRAR